MTIEEQLEVELILEEASAWGLRYEVEQTAKELIEIGDDVVTAYQSAYNEWVK